MIEKAIYGLLSTETELTDICGTRIYPVLAPQEAPLPFTVYSIISTVPSDTKDGESTVDFVRVQIDCYSLDFDQSAEMYIAVRKALDRKYETVNGVVLDGSKYDTHSSFYEEDGEAFRYMSEYTFRHKRTL